MATLCACPENASGSCDTHSVAWYERAGQEMSQGLGVTYSKALAQDKMRSCLEMAPPPLSLSASTLSWVQASSRRLQARTGWRQRRQWWPLGQKPWHQAPGRSRGDFTGHPFSSRANLLRVAGTPLMLAVFGSDAGLLQASCQDPQGSLIVTRTATLII